MLYDTRQTPDTSLPGNAKIGWNAETGTTNLGLPIRGCDAAGFLPDDLLCARHVPEGIRITRSVRQERGYGKSALKSDARMSGTDFYYLATTVLDFKAANDLNDVTEEKLIELLCG